MAGKSILIDAPGDAPSSFDVDGTPKSPNPQEDVTWRVETPVSDRMDVLGGIGDPGDAVRLRGSDGTPSRWKSEHCPSCYFLSAEGDRVGSPPQSGHVAAQEPAPGPTICAAEITPEPGTPSMGLDIEGRDSNGLGGHLGVTNAPAGTAPFIHTAEGIDVTCQTGSCDRVREHLPTAPGQGGWTEYFSANDGSTAVIHGAPYGPAGERDEQVGVVRGPDGTVRLRVWHRNADGSGGGAIAETTGRSLAYGSDAFGNRMRTSGDGGRAGLLYAEEDGYHAGQSCVAGSGGECGGSDPRPLKWSPQLYPSDFTGPVDSDAAQLRYLESQSHLRWMTEVDNPQLTPVARAINRARSGGLSPAEAQALAAQLDSINPKTWQRAQRTAAALENVLTVNGTQPPSTEDVERRLAEDPHLVDTLSSYTFDPKRPPSELEITEAKRTLLDQQEVSAVASGDLERLRPRQEELARRQDAYETAVTDYLHGRGGDPAAIEAQRRALVQDMAALETDQRPILDRLAASQDVLRAYDLAAAGAAGEPAYAENIAQARENLDAIQGLADALPTPTTPRQAAMNAKLLAFGDAAELGYQASIEAPRAPTNRLNDMQLPSTGSPDLALALRSAAGYSYARQLQQAHNTPLIHPDGRELSPDELANFAANWFPGTPTNAAEVAAYDSVPRTAADAQALVAGRPGDPGYEAAIDGFFSRANRQGGSYRALAASLPENEKKALDGFQSEVDGVGLLGFFKFMNDGAHLAPGQSVRAYNGQFGAGTDNVWRNVGRDTVVLGTGIVSLPGTVVGGGVVEAANRVKYNGALAMMAPAGVLPSDVPNPTAFADPPPRRPGETRAEYYTRLYPLSGGMLVTPISHGVDRYFGEGDAKKDYAERPLLTLMEDGTPVLLVLGPVTAGLRSGAANAAARGTMARASAASLPRTAANATERSALLDQAHAFETRAARMDTLARVTSVPVHAASVPYYVVGAPVRVAALGTRAVAVPAARAARAGSAAAGERALAGAIGNRPVTAALWNKTSAGLDRAAVSLARGAESARMITRHGLHGSAKVAGAYRTLGVRRAAPAHVIDQGYAVRYQKASRGSATDPVLAARRAALDSAYATSRTHREALASKLSARSTPLAPGQAAAHSSEPGTTPPGTTTPAGSNGTGTGPAPAGSRPAAAVPTTNGSGAGAPLRDQIDAAIEANGNQPMSAAALASELGITEGEIRQTVRDDTGQRDGPAAPGSTLELVDWDASAFVQRRSDPAPTGSRSLEDSPGPTPSGPHRPADNALPAGASAGGGRPSKTTGDGSGLDPGTEPHPQGSRPMGKAERVNSRSPVGSRKHDGKSQNGDPPATPDRPTREEAPTTKGDLKKLKHGLKEKVAEAKGQLAKAKQTRADYLERLEHELATTTDPKRARDLRNTGTRQDQAVKEAETKLAEARHHLANYGKLKRHRAEVHGIKQLWSGFDDTAFEDLRQRALDGAMLSRVKYYALIAEQIRRTHGKRLYDVQLAAAIALDRGVRGWTLRGRLHGAVIEMGTGGGKTLTGMLPAMKRAYENRRAGSDAPGVHVLTSSNTLAADSVGEYQPVARELGLTVEILAERWQTLDRRRAAYGADITIGTASDFIFDLLEDQQVHPNLRVQRGHSFALVDEADMVLLDWGGSPHRLAQQVFGPARRSELIWARNFADRLRPDEVDAGPHGVTISRAQVRTIEQRIGRALTETQLSDVINAKRANAFHEGTHYKIADDVRVEILDNPNGRALTGMRWTQGLHEALEAKHDLPIRAAQQTIARITTVKYLRNYHDLAGMTGTAWEARGQFRSHYRLGVVRIPTAKLDGLTIRNRQVYGSDKAWMDALAQAVALRRSNPAPELIIARTPAEAEAIAALLRELKVRVHVLNALDERIAFEDAVVAAAGRPHAVTVATNIIGRGTDILLGGGKENFPAAHAELVKSGGLRITIARLFESRRATRQAFGRTARNGDPGSARQVLSLDDPILALYANPRLLERLRGQHANQPGPISGKAVQRLVDNAVQRAEKAAERQLKGVIRGKLNPETEIVREIDGETPASTQGKHAAATEATTSAREAQIDQAIAKIDRLQEELVAARNAVAKTEASFAAGGGAPVGPLYQACAQLCRAHSELATALADYRELTKQDALEHAADAHAVADSQQPAGTARAGHTATTDSATDSASSADLNRIATQLLGVDDSVMRRINNQIAAGDYSAAVNSLTQLAGSITIVEMLTEQHWGAAGWAGTAAEHAAITLQRLIIARQGAAAHRKPELTDGFEITELIRSLARLNGMIRTLPRGAAAEALTAPMGQPARNLLDRLRQVNPRAQVTYDLHRLAAEGRISAEEIRHLLHVGQWPGHALPAQAIGDFAARHNLPWSKGTKRHLRAALRQLTPEPTESIGQHASTLGTETSSEATGTDASRNGRTDVDTVWAAVFDQVRSRNGATGSGGPDGSSAPAAGAATTADGPSSRAVEPATPAPTSAAALTERTEANQARGPPWWKRLLPRALRTATGVVGLVVGLALFRHGLEPGLLLAAGAIGPGWLWGKGRSLLPGSTGAARPHTDRAPVIYPIMAGRPGRIDQPSSAASAAVLRYLAGSEWKHRGWDALEIYEWLRAKSWLVHSGKDNLAWATGLGAAQEMRAWEDAARTIEQQRLAELQLDRSVVREAAILETIADFADLLSTVSELGPRAAAELAALLADLEHNTFRADPRRASPRPDTVAWFTPQAYRVGTGQTTTEIRFTQRVEVFGPDLQQALNEVGISLSFDEMLGLADLYVTVHELVHAFQEAVHRATGLNLAEESMRAGLSEPIAPPADSIWTSATLEAERLADGIAYQIVARDIAARYPYLVPRAHLPYLVGAITREMSRGRSTGYDSPHPPSTVQAIMELAARLDQQRPTGEPIVRGNEPVAITGRDRARPLVPRATSPRDPSRDAAVRARHAYVGYADILDGSGTNFTTNPNRARGSYAETDRFGSGEVLTGYLHRDAVLVRFADAQARQAADVDVTRARGDEVLAGLVEHDLGRWAALSGVDAIPDEDNTPDRGALFIEHTGGGSNVAPSTAPTGRPTPTATSDARIGAAQGHPTTQYGEHQARGPPSNRTWKQRLRTVLRWIGGAVALAGAVILVRTGIDVGSAVAVAGLLGLSPIQLVKALRGRTVFLAPDGQGQPNVVKRGSRAPDATSVTKLLTQSLSRILRAMGLGAARPSTGRLAPRAASPRDPSRDATVRARRTALDQWTLAELRAFADIADQNARLQAIWRAQGFDATPKLVNPSARTVLLSAGHTPVYRGLNGSDAAQFAAQFRTGQTPYVGYADILDGSGTNFTTNPNRARGYYAETDEFGTGELLTGYLHRDAVLVRFADAQARQSADADAARARGDEVLAGLIDNDLGRWAALSGVDAILDDDNTPGVVTDDLQSGRDFLVQNRGALFIEHGAPSNGTQENGSIGDTTAPERDGPRPPTAQLPATVVVVGLGAAAAAVGGPLATAVMAHMVVVALAATAVFAIRALVRWLQRGRGPPSGSLFAATPTDFVPGTSGEEPVEQVHAGGPAVGVAELAAVSDAGGSPVNRDSARLASGRHDTRSGRFTPRRLTRAAARWLGRWATAALLIVALNAGAAVTLTDEATAQPPAPTTTAQHTDQILPSGASVASARAPPDAELPVGTPVLIESSTPTPATEDRAFTAARHDTAGKVAAGLGFDRDFAVFNAANDNRFTGPDQRIASQTVHAPASWSGTWITQPGDSYWRIYVVRFHDLAGYHRAVAADPTPNLIHPGDSYGVQAPPPAPAPGPAVGTPKPPERQPAPDIELPGSAPSEDQTTPWWHWVIAGGAAAGLVGAFFAGRAAVRAGQRSLRGWLDRRGGAAAGQPDGSDHGHGQTGHGHQGHGHQGHGHIDPSILRNTTAMWVTSLTTLTLFATAALQAGLAGWLGLDSAALESDIAHNIGDGASGALLLAALGYTAIAALDLHPIRWLVDRVGSAQRANRAARWSIASVIAASGIVVGWESIEKLLHPAALGSVGAVAAVGLVGAALNFAVAGVRQHYGKRLGIPALRDEATHAATDGWVSVGVVGAAVLGSSLTSAAELTNGALAQWLITAAAYADPVIGLAVTGLILQAAWAVAAELRAEHPVRAAATTLAQVRAALATATDTRAALLAQGVPWLLAHQVPQADIAARLGLSHAAISRMMTDSPGTGARPDGVPARAAATLDTLAAALADAETVISGIAARIEQREIELRAAVRQHAVDREARRTARRTRADPAAGQPAAGQPAATLPPALVDGLAKQPTPATVRQVAGAVRQARADAASADAALRLAVEAGDPPATFEARTTIRDGAHRMLAAAEDAATRWATRHGVDPGRAMGNPGLARTPATAATQGQVAERPEPVGDALARLRAARHGFVELRENGSRWLFAGTGLAPADVAEQLRALGIEPLDARAYLSAGGSTDVGLGAPTGSVEQRARRLRPLLDAATAELDSATDAVRLARRQQGRGSDDGTGSPTGAGAETGAGTGSAQTTSADDVGTGGNQAPTAGPDGAGETPPRWLGCVRPASPAIPA